MNIFNNYKKKCNNALKLVETNNISKIKEKVKILIVDDEEFGIIDLLMKRKFNIFYKKDITYSIEAEPFDIVILDIKGIGKNYGSSMEGFAIAEQIKKEYPNKSVHCFSGSLSGEIAERITKIDSFITKDSDIDKWNETLENIIKNYLSIDYQWKALEDKLKESHISEEDIRNIDKEFRKGFEEKSFTKFSDLLISSITNADKLLSILVTVYKFVSLFSK